MKDERPDWGELRSEWQGNASLDLVAGSLRGALTWRIWFSRAWFALEVLSFLYLGLVVVMNLAAGEMAKGAGLGVIVAFCLAASIWARRGRLVGGLDSVPGMIELARSRARKSLRIVYATYAVIAVTLIGALLETLQLPAPEDRFTARLISLSVCAAATVAYHLYALMRIRHLDVARRRFVRD